MIRSADNCELLYCYYDSWPHSSSCFANFNYAPTSLKLKISIEDNSAKTSFNNMLLIFPELINLVGLELFSNKNLLCNLYRLHQCCGWEIRLWPDFLILVLDQVLQFHNWVFPVKNLPEQNNVESLLFSTGFLPKTVVCSMKTIRPKKYLWKWSRVLLNVTALKKKRGDAPGYVWAQQLHPQDLIRRAVSWKD